MGTEQKRAKEAPVRASEVLSGVLAALAVTQIVQGTFAAFYSISTQPDPPTSRYWAAGLIAVFLTVTAVRLFHRNAVYLESHYGRWSHKEVQPNAWLATPLRHAIDIFVHIFEYAALGASGYLLDKDPSFRGTTWAVVALLVIDTLWVAVKWIRENNEPGNLSWRPLGIWCISNLLSGAVLAIIGGVWSTAWWSQWTFLGVLSFSTAVDYFANYDHYFDPRVPASSLGLSQAATSIGYLVGLSEVPQQCVGKPLSRPTLQKLTEDLFGFFMESPDNRDKLFCRRSTALLHIGLYLNDDGKLKPVVRYKDSKIATSNRQFPIGEGYIGSAYVELKDKPDGAQFNPHRDPKWMKRKNGKKDPYDRFYKSSILVNVFWPPDTRSEAIGTLVVTSSQEEYFTKNVHEMLLIGISGFLTLSLGQMKDVGSLSPTQLKAEILRYCGRAPIEADALKGDRSHERGTQAA